MVLFSQIPCRQHDDFIRIDRDRCMHLCSTHNDAVAGFPDYVNVVVWMLLHLRAQTAITLDVSLSNRYCRVVGATPLKKFHYAVIVLCAEVLVRLLCNEVKREESVCANLFDQDYQCPAQSRGRFD